MHSALRLACCILVLTLGACGGGGGGSGGGDGGTPTPTPSASPTPTASPGQALSLRRSVDVGGRTHEYRLFVPAARVGASDVPLVISLHGGNTNAENHDLYTRLRLTAAKYGFALMTPEGFGTTWNAGSCCAPATTFAIDHVAVISAMLDDVAAVLDADPRRVFATGHSNGGMMAYRLGCQLSDRIAAIAPNSATMMDRNLNTNPPTEVFACQPTRPVPVLHIHGLADTCVPFNGGQSTGPAGGTRPPVSDSIDFWADNNRCLLPPLLATYSNGAARCDAHTGCQASARVELCTIEGAGHVWPGNGFSPPADDPCGGTGSNDLDANERIWGFFSAHPMP